MTKVYFSLTIAIFAIALAFLFTSAACKAGPPPPKPVQVTDSSGWIVKGSAVPWMDNRKSLCSILYYL